MYCCTIMFVPQTISYINWNIVQYNIQVPYFFEKTMILSLPKCHTKHWFRTTSSGGKTLDFLPFIFDIFSVYNTCWENWFSNFSLWYIWFITEKRFEKSEFIFLQNFLDACLLKTFEENIFLDCFSFVLFFDMYSHHFANKRWTNWNSTRIDKFKNFSYTLLMTLYM